MDPEAQPSTAPDHAGREPFYVDPDCCLLCGVPEAVAPELFENGENHCIIKRQPMTAAEVDSAIKVMWSSEVDCIRYSGADEALLNRLGQAGLSAYADDPRAADAVVLTRDRVSFTLPSTMIGSTSPAMIAKAFRRDLKRGGRIVLPALLGPETVRLAWPWRKFHSVTFRHMDERTMVATLKSKRALVSLAWLVDEWLRSRGTTAIRWHANGDPQHDKGRSTPI